MKTLDPDTAKEAQEDAEAAALGDDPRFVALLEQSRRHQQEQGGISAAEMRRRLGL